MYSLFKSTLFIYTLKIVPFEVDSNLRLSPILSSVHSGLSPSRGWVHSGLSPSRGWVHPGLSAGRDWVQSLSPFGVESILSSVHSEFSPFWVRSIMSSIHSEFSPFWVMSIRGSVHSGLGPFEVQSIRGWVFLGSVILGSVVLGSVCESYQVLRELNNSSGRSRMTIFGAKNLKRHWRIFCTFYMHFLSCSGRPLQYVKLNSAYSAKTRK